MQQTVIAVLHARTPWNRTGRIQGKKGPPLDNDGFIETVEKVQKIAAFHLFPQLVISSDLPRSVDTARTIARMIIVPWLTDKRLQECDFGSLEECFETDLASWCSPDIIESWKTYHDGTFKYDFRPMGGEDDEAVRSRHLACWHDLATITAPPFLLTTPRTIIVVGHGRGFNTLLHTLGFVPPLLRRDDVRVISYPP